MKLFDEVKVIKDREEYNKQGIFKGMVGTIIDAEIRFNAFQVIFTDDRAKDRNFMSVEDNIFKLKDDIIEYIKIEDLDTVKKVILQMNSFWLICLRNTQTGGAR